MIDPGLLRDTRNMLVLIIFIISILLTGIVCYNWGEKANHYITMAERAKDYQEDHREATEVKLEAVARGFAEWKINQYGTIRFAWKEGKKEE